MENSTSSDPELRSSFRERFTSEAYASGVSWAAVIAGAFVTAALWLILLVLGAGIGLSTVSPWSNIGASASTIGAAAIIWMIVVQFIAASTGGYLAGRLRTKWATIHSDEVYFRDTAHGFLVWALGLVATAAFLTSAAASIVSGAARPQTAALSTPRGTEIGSSPSVGTEALDSSEYFISALFRSDHPNRTDGSARAEAKTIFAHDLRQKNLPGADRTYLANLVSTTTGISQLNADRRVSEVFTQLQHETDVTRKATARLFLWLFIALLIGAFCASVAATLGGRERDRVQVV